MSADWPQLVDRAQIRSRLEALGDAAVLDDADIAFLLFYFRASDPELYRAAALTAGRQLRHSPVLYRELSAYAESRGTSLSRPVGFIGHRSMRRLVLVLAAALADPRPADPALSGVALPDLPFATEPGGEGPRPILPKADADLANLLLAMTVLADAATGVAAAMQRMADALLLRIAETPERVMERTVARRWGELLALRVSQESRSPIVDGWGAVVESCLSVLRELDTDDVAGRLPMLASLDEATRAAAHFPSPVRESAWASLAPGLRRLEARFLELRWATWRRRDYGDRRPTLTSPPADDSSSAALAAAASREIAAEAADGVGGRPETAAVARTVEALLRPLQAQAEWRSVTGAERSLTAFLLIDALRHDPPPVQRCAALAARFGLPIPEAGSGHGDRNAEDTLLVSVLLRLFAWEGHAADSILDYRLVHAIEDPALLAGLLPTARNSRLTPVIADAVEHRIRLRLHREPGFDPETILLLMLARRPHPAFLEAIAAVCKARIYTDSDGRAYDLGRLVERLRDAAQPAPGQPFRETAAAGKFAAFARRLSEVHDDLQTPAHRLQRFLASVGQPDDDGQRGFDTAMAVVRALQPEHGPLVSAGDAPWESGDRRTLEQAVGEHLARLAAATGALAEDAWRDPDLTASRLETLRMQLGLLERRLAPHLPMAEAAAFEASRVALDGALAEWGAGMASIAQAWTSAAHDGSADAARAWSRLLDSVPATWPAATRDAAATGILDALVPEIDLVTTSLDGNIVVGDPSSSPERAQAVLDWGVACETPGREWRAALTHLWSELLRVCMARHDEGRVLSLLRAPQYAALRRSPGLADHLAAAKHWLLDRYRPLAVHRLNREIAGARSEAAPGLGAVSASFAAHYVAYWIGLLVGAILMLDFGDAWTEMAEQGDVPGIAVTFLIGVAGTYAYLLYGLRRRVAQPAGAHRFAFWWSLALRSGGMLMLCLAYTLLVTSGLWVLLSGTDAVVHGPMAIGHIVVWAGFALFVGIFFGLIAKQ